MLDYRAHKGKIRVQHDRPCARGRRGGWAVSAELGQRSLVSWVKSKPVIWRVRAGTRFSATPRSLSACSPSPAPQGLGASPSQADLQL